jgi:hypothetical protein
MAARNPGNRSHGIISRGPHQTGANCGAKTLDAKTATPRPKQFHFAATAKKLR